MKTKNQTQYKRAAEEAEKPLHVQRGEEEWQKKQIWKK